MLNQIQTLHEGEYTNFLLKKLRWLGIIEIGTMFLDRVNVRPV